LNEFFRATDSVAREKGMAMEIDFENHASASNLANPGSADNANISDTVNADNANNAPIADTAENRGNTGST
jgi:hypothetical protein